MKTHINRKGKLVTIEKEDNTVLYGLILFTGLYLVCFYGISLYLG